MLREFEAELARLPCHKNGGEAAMLIAQRKLTMKQTRIITRITLATFALAVALAGALLLTGCASGHNGGNASDHSGHQGSCH